MRWRRSLLALALLLAALAGACERAAELIPGETGTPVVEDPNATPTPLIAPPIVPPGSVNVAGDEGRNGTPGAVIPDSQLARSVVQLQLLDSSSGFVESVRDGSGVVIDRAQRLILTSYALVNPLRDDGTPAYTTIAVGTNRSTGGAPSLEFEAELLAADPKLDTAVLRVTRAYRGEPIAPGEFNLPAAEIGDADALEHGDVLRLLGHPGLELESAADSQAVVATTAAVTGFRGDATIEGRVWLKTDARLPYGAGGGPVFNAAGALVGIATQLAYDPQATVGQVRSVTLALAVIEQARRAGPAARYRPTLRHPSAARNTPLPALADGIVVGDPAFAENAVEGNGLLDLFDYTSEFLTRPPALYYEYSLQGLPDGAMIEERWYLEGIFQDALSSSFIWSLGSFEIIADSLVAPGARGIPAGVWTLEIWVNELLRASGTAYIAVEPPGGSPGEPPGEPRIGGFAFGSSISDEQGVLLAPSSQARQLFAFFDYEDAGGVTQLRWIVFRDGRVVHQSALLPWEGGDSGSWWVGYAADGPIGAGFWEFEIYLDSPEQRQPVSRGADGVRLF